MMFPGSAYRFLTSTLVYLLATAAAPAQDGVFTGGMLTDEYPRISFDVRVVSGGGAAYPPDPSRIILRENGRDLAFTLDCDSLLPRRPSLALGFERSLDGNFPVEREAARRFLERMRFTRDGAEASFWSFATFIDRDVPMTRDSARLARAIDDLTVAQWPFNGTALYETMHRAIEDVNEFGSGESKAVVFFTDGFNNSNRFGRTWEQVRGRAAVDNIRIYVILVRNRDAGRDAMGTLTRATGGFMVEQDVPGAADSVYADIVRPDTLSAWCRLRYVSPLCANGSARRVHIGYVRAPGDTLWTEMMYTAPYIPDDLLPLRLWVSPGESWSDMAEMTVAVGVEVRDGEQLPAFTLALPLQGLTLENAVGLDWNASAAEQGNRVHIAATPPAAGLTAGRYVLARLRVGNPVAVRVRFAPELVEDASGCLRLELLSYPAVATAVLDTVLSERRSSVLMPVRVTPDDVPEGLQRVRLRLAADPLRVRFDAVRPVDETVLPEGWSITGWQLYRTADTESVLEFRAVGPPLDTAGLLARIRLQVLDEPVYRIPVTLQDRTVFNREIGAQREHGLIVIRDSCFNNLVAPGGLVLSRPWPQPARERVHIHAMSTREEVLLITIRDALGRPLRSYPAVRLSAGSRVLQLDLGGIAPGRYVISCEGAGAPRRLPLIVLQ